MEGETKRTENSEEGRNLMIIKEVILRLSERKERLKAVTG